MNVTPSLRVLGEVLIVLLVSSAIGFIKMHWGQITEDEQIFQAVLSKEQQSELREIALKLVEQGKGILAADESTDTMGKRLATIGVENSAENRRSFRQLLFTTTNISQHISGIILYEETFHQRDDTGKRFVEIISEAGVLVGIKLDKGVRQLDRTSEFITEGLDDLAERAAFFKMGGCQFAKWRCVYVISDGMPSRMALKKNAEVLMRYAVVTQQAGLVPIIEPEAKHGEIANATIEALLRTVPAAVPGIVFLSGGQSEIDATRNLNEINELPVNKPWKLSFSYGRALQTSALRVWRTESEKEAQSAFLHRAKLNGLAAEGKYDERLEKSVP